MGMPIIKKHGIKVDEAIADLIESIALEEAALAHILNAEGEKLQKVICSRHVSIGTLLETNESVENMVTKITALEKELVEKLKDAKEILGLDKKHHRYNENDILDAILEVDEQNDN